MLDAYITDIDQFLGRKNFAKWIMPKCTALGQRARYANEQSTYGVFKT